MLPSARSYTSASAASTFARQLSARLTSQPSARILVSRALVASSSSWSSSSISCATLQQQRRCQSSHALTSSPATRGSNNNSSKDADVKPWLRQYRPQVNGRAVAFHVSDLLKSPPPSTSSSSSCTSTNSTEFRPAQERQYESDLVVILDMDECMIHSQFLSSPSNAQVYAHQLQRQRRNSRGSNGDDGAEQRVVDHFRVHLPSTGDLVHVNVRPGLREFLQKVTARYETHVFTAAMAVYARPVLEQLDPHGNMFSQVWYREHCRYDAQHNAYLKDLEALPAAATTLGGSSNSSTIKLNRTVLIDNNPLSFITHPENGILVSSFYNDAQDNTLPAVFDLLQELESYPDVRPVLDRRFGLKSALLGQQAQAQQQKKTKMASTASVPLTNIVQQQQASVVQQHHQQVVAAF